jgi:hypothetical protein
MTGPVFYFVMGVGACLLVGMAALSGYLAAELSRHRKQVFGLMHDKGMLTMRVSILEDALKEKGR